MKKHWNLQTIHSQTDLHSWMIEIAQAISNIHEQLQQLPTTNWQPIVQNILNDLQEVIGDTDEIEDSLACLSEVLEDEDSDMMAQLLSQHARVMQQRSSLQATFAQALKHLPEKEWLRFLDKPALAPIRFYLDEQRTVANALLAPEQEHLIQALSTDGFHRWEDYYDIVRAACQISHEGKVRSIDTTLHDVSHIGEREERKALAQALEQTLDAHADTFAYQLNSIAGFRLNLYKQRGWRLLQETCQQNRISEQALQVMCGVIDQHQTLARTFFKRKIALTRVNEPAWYDLSIANFSSDTRLSYEQAAELIITQCHRFNERAGKLATHAFSAGWIETGTDEGGWGFCASLPRSKESRIFLPFRGTYTDVVTLAHEFGHAYHNHLLHDEPIFAQQKGTSAAEVASTFMENLVLDAVLAQTNNTQDTLALLETKIQADFLYVTTIPQLFAFEQQLYHERQTGILSAKELCHLLSEVQMPVYEGIITDVYQHEWVTLPHLYDTRKAFYNIPYTIGYFLSGELYNRSKQTGASFAATYDAFLKDSGKMTIEQLAQTYLQADLCGADFWEKSLQPLRDTIDLYISLTEGMVGDRNCV
ncbi:M3 family metallopeptidase [Shouchella lonarensis]|uniref:Oligoendopeptidase F n=1 Tax=Shouchella lonarensis TaxID=1464122 RepID=A0A1G6GUF9_9BACI|nr:M3 family metallopeptidase [Shouchella lonarensis]SDB85604.1 Oligoendopeptidase F [Shouchella lonarensis]